MIFTKITDVIGHCFLCAMSLKPTCILTKAIFLLKKPFFNRIMCVSQGIIVVAKKVDKRLKALNVCSQDFENVIELLRQYKKCFIKMLEWLEQCSHTQKMEKTWKMKNFVIITNAKQASNVLSIMSKEVRKGKKNCILPEVRLHDIMQDSKDLELKTAFRERPSLLEILKIRSLWVMMQWPLNWNTIKSGGTF